MPNSYRGKVQNWSDLAAENNSLFVCLQETHLHPGVLDAEINLKNFTAFRTDRKNRKNGGVVNYIREDLVVREEFSFSNSYCESSAQHIPKLKLCLINIYRPPNCPSNYFQETLELVEDFLEGLGGEQGAPSIVLTGDLNLPFIRNWNRPALEALCAKVAERENSRQSTAADQRQAVMLIQWAERHFMEQYIKESTRGSNILHFIFCPNLALILGCRLIINSQNFSDHKSLVVDLSIGLLHCSAAKGSTTT